MKKLTRDKVISVVDGKDLVGVYWKGTNGKDILFECFPEKADRIVEIFNSEDGEDRTITIEVRGGVVLDVQNLPAGYDYEIKDYDN
ncbi:hypothetical protein MYX76_09535 [Desulfobacterota bacterium AH_259_B03_O07]|nr:hypothetical protein [Desulfobacterota bacterium AH_259_B03_O07]